MVTPYPNTHPGVLVELAMHRAYGSPLPKGFRATSSSNDCFVHEDWNYTAVEISHDGRSWKYDEDLDWQPVPGIDDLQPPTIL